MRTKGFCFFTSAESRAVIPPAQYIQDHLPLPPRENL